VNALPGWTKLEQARQVAALLEPKSVVNVGVGMPVMVPAAVDPAQQIMFHCENGLIGYQALAATDRPDPDIIDARCEPVRLVVGSSVVGHDVSFAIARGGRLDATVLGAYQVAANGDLANWSAGKGSLAGIGGAMDLAVGARRVIVMMRHTSRDGGPKIVRRCDLPLTAMACVNTVVTELAVIDVTPRGLLARTLAPGVGRDYLQERTGAPVLFSEPLPNLLPTPYPIPSPKVAERP
jgi:3-oxoacid CoA-transferase B subunit